MSEEKPVPCEIASKIYDEHTKNCKTCQTYRKWFAEKMLENVKI